jgi:hypothetical protein
MRMKIGNALECPELLRKRHSHLGLSGNIDNALIVECARKSLISDMIMGMTGNDGTADCGNACWDWFGNDDPGRE